MIVKDLRQDPAKKLSTQNFEIEHSKLCFKKSDLLVKCSRFSLQGDLFDFFYVLNSTLLHLPPLRFHCVGGCCDRTQDCCAVRRSNHWAIDLILTQIVEAVHAAGAAAHA